MKKRNATSHPIKPKQVGATSTMVSVDLRGNPDLADDLTLLAKIKGTTVARLVADALVAKYQSELTEVRKLRAVFFANSVTSKLQAVDQVAK
jgi:hypothetical protein